MQQIEQRVDPVVQRPQHKVARTQVPHERRRRRVAAAAEIAAATGWRRWSCNVSARRGAGTEAAVAEDASPQAARPKKWRTHNQQNAKMRFMAFCSISFTSNNTSSSYTLINTSSIKQYITNTTIQGRDHGEMHNFLAKSHIGISV